MHFALQADIIKPENVLDLNQTPTIKISTDTWKVALKMISAAQQNSYIRRTFPVFPCNCPTTVARGVFITQPTKEWFSALIPVCLKSIIKRLVQDNKDALGHGSHKCNKHSTFQTSAKVAHTCIELPDSVQTLLSPYFWCHTIIASCWRLGEVQAWRAKPHSLFFDH